jgi:hypothetical protein
VIAVNVTACSEKATSFAATGIIYKKEVSIQTLRNIISQVTDTKNKTRMHWHQVNLIA